MISDMEIMDRGITCLLETLGIVGTEYFILARFLIAVINRKRFDYMKWQRRKFDSMSSEEFNEAAVAYEEQNPFIPEH